MLTLLGFSVGYANHEVPSDEYKEAALPICQERLMQGGARLAALIEDIYGDNEASLYERFSQKVFAYIQWMMTFIDYIKSDDVIYTNTTIFHSEVKLFIQSATPKTETNIKLYVTN